MYVVAGYSKEPSQWDGTFEQPKHMLKLMDKKIFTILRWKFKPMTNFRAFTVNKCIIQLDVKFSLMGAMTCIFSFGSVIFYA